MLGLIDRRHGVICVKKEPCPSRPILVFRSMVQQNAAGADREGGTARGAVGVRGEGGKRQSARPWEPKGYIDLESKQSMNNQKKLKCMGKKHKKTVLGGKSRKEVPTRMTPSWLLGQFRTIGETGEGCGVETSQTARVLMTSRSNGRLTGK